MHKSLTDKVRKFAWVLWGAAIIASVLGWFFDKDPAKLAPVIGWVTTAALGAEGANVGKRATYKKDHHENSAS